MYVSWLLATARENVVLRLALVFEKRSSSKSRGVYANLVSCGEGDFWSDTFAYVDYAVREGSSQSHLDVKTSCDGRKVREDIAVRIVRRWNETQWAKHERIVCTIACGKGEPTLAEEANIWVLQALNRLQGAIGERKYSDDDSMGHLIRMEHHLGGLIADANSELQGYLHIA